MCGARLPGSPVVFGDWCCTGRYVPALLWASLEGGHARWNLPGLAPGTKVARDRLGGAALGDQAELPRAGDGLGAVGRAELAEDVGDVLFDRVEADYQLVGDALVRRARGQQR
jgi:hypothetical protein